MTINNEITEDEYFYIELEAYIVGEEYKKRKQFIDDLTWVNREYDTYK